MAEPDFEAVIGGVASVAMSLGVFERVNRFEPTSSPGTGLTCAIWVEGFKPVRERSGLASVSMLLMLTVRIQAPDPYRPQEGQDPRMLQALSSLFAALCADFDISVPDGSAEVSEIDLLGMVSEGLTSDAGYVRMAGGGQSSDSGELYRIIDLQVPLILDDVYPQSR